MNEVVYMSIWTRIGVSLMSLDFKVIIRKVGNENIK